ncbi:MAG: class I SAM-dependent methyltransferase [Salinivirgaceae bacterium]|jgi:glycine/sarcosine N-methyltransferase|nr:class I SAM-dependent methyltransferase [Salinivirgaceae bacterium]
MSFYKSIANFYDYIFPLNINQVDFVLKSVPKIEQAKILDIGCGTGSLTNALSEICSSVVGIDLDTEMLSIAENKKSSENVQFIEGNMLGLSNQFENNSFDTIVCFGNTLVHLDNIQEIGSFLSQSHQILKKGGKLFIQIINYDRILNEEINFLPTIENSKIKFTRDYVYLSEDHKINFTTELFNKQTCTQIENQQLLYPLKRQEISQLLKANGFNELHIYGSFKKEPFTFESVPLIIEAEKL